MKERIIKNNLIACILTAILTVLICFLTYAYTFERTMDAQARSQGYLLKEICEQSTDVTQSLKMVQTNFKGRITLVDFDGKVIFDSSYDEYTLENHLSRQEIATAVANGVGNAKRYSKTDGKTNYYYAIKINNIGVIRVGVHSSQLLAQAVLPHMPLIIFSILAVLIFTIWVSTITTKKIVKTIEDYDFNGDNTQIYDELSPFISKIHSQNNTIAIQSEKNKAEKDKLESVFLNMKECIIVCDNYKTIVQTNKEAEKIFSIYNKDNFSAVLRNAELNKNLQSALELTTAHGVLQQEGRSYQYTVSPNIQNESCAGAILIALDITEQTESQKLRREFTANVTHELKTPLTSILGYSQLITNGMAKQEDVVGFAYIIEKNAQRLLTLIEDIMQISALEEGGAAEKQKLSFKVAIEEVIKDLKPLAAEKDIEIVPELCDMYIVANLKHLGDIARNLISNAIKYNKQGGKVTVVLKKEGKNLLFEVCDTGIGIPKKDIDKVFERFYVVDKARNKSISSTGLGLSIVKHIVNSMGGTVQLTSKIGEGSKFVVTIPL